MKSVAAAAFWLLMAGNTLAASKPPATGDSILPGGDSKAPISVEADKLVYFEKELKAIYTGNVIAIQGDSKLTCSTLTIYMEKAGAATPAGSEAAPSKTAEPSAAPQSSRMRHMDCSGPVTMMSKTQTATGDNGSYDKPSNRVQLMGHVTLSDGRNVTKGDKLTYDMTTGQATLQTGSSSPRVTGQFLPGSAESPTKPKAP
jgi:lipopolysaccharide export system protein LptA